MTRGVAYLRVSTTDQSVETQRPRVQALASQLGLELPEDRILVDDGVTGRTMDRPRFERLRELVRSRTVDAVLTTKLDRLGRSARGVLEFFDLCRENRVRVVVADLGVDTSTPVGRFFLGVAAAYAELEAEQIAERTRDRLAYLSDRHRETGVWETRSGRPVGRPGRLTPELLAEIRRLRESGLKWDQVAIRVHVRATTARKWLSAAKRADRASVTEEPRVINHPRGIGT